MEPPWWGVWGAKAPRWMHEELLGSTRPYFGGPGGRSPPGGGSGGRSPPARSTKNFMEDPSKIYPSSILQSIKHPSIIHQLSFDHPSMDIYISMDIYGCPWMSHPSKIENSPVPSPIESPKLFLPDPIEWRRLRRYLPQSQHPCRPSWKIYRRSINPPSFNPSIIHQSSINYPSIILLWIFIYLWISMGNLIIPSPSL